MPMGRNRLGAERKQVYSVSLEPALADQLRVLGAGSLSAGFAAVVDMVIEAGGLETIGKSREAAAAALQTEKKAREAQAELRAKIAESQRVARAAALSTQEAVDRENRIKGAAFTYSSINAERFRMGKPLLSRYEIPMIAQDRVLAEALALYGWSEGPPPGGLVLPPDEPEPALVLATTSAPVPIDPEKDPELAAAHAAWLLEQAAGDSAAAAPAATTATPGDMGVSQAAWAAANAGLIGHSEPAPAPEAGLEAPADEGSATAVEPAAEPAPSLEPVF